MTLVGDTAANRERTPSNAVRRSFAVGYDEVDEMSGGESADAVAPRLTWRERRKQRRIRARRLFVMPVVVALLLVSAKLLSMCWWAQQGASAYDDARYAASRSEFAPLRTVNVIEPWKAWMALGTAYFRLDDLPAAESAFMKALELNQDRCDVRFNLAVTIEADGDRRMGNDVNEVTETEQLDGLARYRVALDVVNAARCEVEEPDGPGALLAETRERLEAKLGAEESSRDGSSRDNPDDESDTEAEASDNAVAEDQLEQRNQTGAQERQDSSDLDPTAQQPPNEPNW